MILRCILIPLTSFLAKFPRIFRMSMLFFEILRLFAYDVTMKFFEIVVILSTRGLAHKKVLLN